MQERNSSRIALTKKRYTLGSLAAFAEYAHQAGIPDTAEVYARTTFFGRLRKLIVAKKEEQQ